MFFCDEGKVISNKHREEFTQGFAEPNWPEGLSYIVGCLAWFMQHNCKDCQPMGRVFVELQNRLMYEINVVDD